MIRDLDQAGAQGALGALEQGAHEARCRRRLTVRGIVQGVGFRPFVYTLATRLGLAGFVGNDSRGVFVEVEGPTELLDRFQAALLQEAPPLASIQSLQVEEMPRRGERAFTIVASRPLPSASTLISADLATCDDCLRELFDPRDRRYRYPFINCTHCGPRFTIIKDIPYDRPLTTMAPFALCAQCAAEYADPLNRRYHAQPIACPRCGPHVWLEMSGESAVVAQRHDALVAVLAALRAGAIVAIKGLGGFHLACDARSDAAVRDLRRRKGRGDKPFAVMVRDLHVAQRIAAVGAAEATRLTSRARPIVLLTQSGSGLAPSVAPGLDTVGVMLPYTPLHHLLLEEFPLVMTSGNLGGEPIESDNEQARARLAPLVDAFLFHDRGIHVPVDDSVTRVFRGLDLPIRRSRGYAPLPVALPFSIPSVLAVGGELKSTICLTRDDQAILSQHIGDMENLETLQAFNRVVEHLETLFRATPARVVCDLHPGYFSSTWAARLAAQRGIPLLRVQHHHAHIAAVMAEHRVPAGTPVLGIAFDGTGYGPDGAIWGGEVLVADYEHCRRAAHLRSIPLPGGDAAIRHPHRCALAYLWACGIPWDADLPPVAATTETQRRVLRRQCETGLHSTPTSSMGRLFDAVASLIGIRQSVSFEAQAAIELEVLAGTCGLTPAVHGYTFAVHPDEHDPACLILDPAPVLSAIVTDLRAGVARAVIAARFHLAVADLVASLVTGLRDSVGSAYVALSGGVFQNTRLLALTIDACAAQGMTVLTHHQVPPNDGGLALGQAIIGGLRPLA